MKPFLCLTAVAAVAASLVFGVAGTAAADTATAGGITYSADPGAVAAGATVTGHSGAAGAVVIPDTIVVSGVRFNVTAVGDGAFDAASVTSVVLGRNVVSVGDSSFINNIGLTSVQLNNGLQTLGVLAFGGDTALTSVVIPDSVTTVGDAAFSGDTALASVDFGSGITTIGVQTFEGCPVTTITLPASLTSVDIYAFFDNPLLTDVYLLGAPPSVQPAGVSGASFGGAGVVPTIHYDLAFASPADPTGYTSPNWLNYPTEAFAAVSFNLDGHGSAVKPQLVDPGDTAFEPSAPTASGWKFTGWFTTAALTTRADFSDPITADTTVFAGWAALPRLALTGGTINPLVLPIGGAVLVVGVVLVILGARRRRANRRD